MRQPSRRTVATLERFSGEIRRVTFEAGKLAQYPLSAQ
jgi:hypothetical protein